MAKKLPNRAYKAAKMFDFLLLNDTNLFLQFFLFMTLKSFIELTT
jgi:hypothetical protein